MSNEHPDPADVAEDAHATAYDFPNSTWSVDRLAEERDSLAQRIRELSIEKVIVEQELWRRAKLARPEVETAGTAVLAGENVALTVGADRTWEWVEGELLRLQMLKDPQDRFLLTSVEYTKLVKWEPKVDGRFYNSLMRRGGFLAEALERCRTLKSSRPTFDVKARE